MGAPVSEAQLQDDIRLALGRDDDLVLWRNNVGAAKQGNRTIRYGVGGRGGADLIGMYRGLFVAIEIKTPIGRQSPEQRTFQLLVERKGGVYGLVRSVQQALDFVAELRARTVSR